MAPTMHGRCLARKQALKPETLLLQQWLPAEQAIYVIDSDRRGGMGALEAVPFSRREPAEAFVGKHGGQIVTWNEIPQDYILERSIEAVQSPSLLH